MTSSSAPSVKGIAQSLLQAYNKEASTQTKIVDLFLVYVVLTALVQVVYCALVGSFPFNSFLAGFFSCAGVFALTVSLRLQVSSERAVEKAFGEYVFCMLLLFLVVFNFMG